MLSATRRPRRRAVSAALGCAAATVLLSAAPASASLTHFLQPPASFPFAGVHEPNGLAVDQANHFVYVATQAESVLKFDTSGEPADFSALSSNELAIPNSGLRHLAVDGSGDLYVTDSASETVHKFLPSGKPDPTTPTIGAGVLTSPRGVAVDGAGDVYVGAGGSDEEQSIVNPENSTCTFKGQATTPVSDGTEFGAALEKLSTIGPGNVYVTFNRNFEGGDSNVAVITFIGALANENVPQITCSQGGETTRSQGAPSTVYRFGPTGALLNEIGSEVIRSSELNDLALDSAANLYVATSKGAFAFAANGACLNSCNPIDPGGASAVAVEPATDHLYVANRERQTARINEYDSLAKGNPELGSFGFGVFSSCGVQSLAVDGASGNVYSSDLCTNNGDGQVNVFGPAVIIPTLHTAPVSELQQTSVTLNGTLNSAGTAPAEALTDCHFDFVTEGAFEKTGFSDLSSGGEAPCVPAAASIPNDGADHPVSAQVSGLDPVTPYRFQLVATNQNGTNEAEGQPFTTAGPPSIDAQSVDAIEKAAATLHARVNPSELDTKAHFEYITAADYAANGQSFTGAHPATSTAVEGLGSGLGDVSTEAQIAGLLPGTEYRFRTVASSSAKTVTGADQTFTTVQPALFALQSPTALTTTAATLHVYLDPEGLPTTYRFEYGATTAYGQSTPELSAGEAESFGLQSAPISGLAAGTEYHYRILATNSAGAAASPDAVFTTSPAGCPNQALREEDGSTALPDCRAYEMVSPEQKGGVGLHEAGAVPAPSGDRILFTSEASFAGDLSGTPTAGYLARRQPTGWLTTPISNVPVGLGRGVFSNFEAANSEFTEFLSSPIVVGANNVGQADAATGGTLYLRRADDSFVPASPLLSTADGGEIYAAWESAAGHLKGYNSDLSRLVVGARGAGFLPSEPGQEHLYEVLGAATPLRILNREDGAAGAEIPVCVSTGGQLLLGPEGDPTAAHEVSEDGSRVFFSERSPALPGGCPVAHLFARIDGQRTLDLADPSDPAAEPWVNEECTTPACRAAPLRGSEFQGASADGSKVFFTSTQQLTDAATQDNLESDNSFGNKGVSCSSTTDSGCNLYAYDFARPAGHHLLDLSAGDSSGQGPQVRQVLASSEDGSRLYFIARGLLTSQPNSLGQTAHAGAENLYLANANTGKLTFLAEHCGEQDSHYPPGEETERSGTAHGILTCPGSGQDDAELADLTPDGRFLILTTYAQLTPDDTNLAADVYRYDAQTGALLRVSIGHDGEDLNGNGGGQNAAAGGGGPFSTFVGDQKIRPHYLSADGSTIAFVTARPLQASAENGLANAYLWHQGQVTLLSGGKAHSDLVGSPAVSSSGHDVFFVSDQGLLTATDTDGLADLYDARIDGGFPTPPPSQAICESPGTCHGPIPPLPAPPPIGTQEFRSGGNVKEPHCKKHFVLRHGKCVKVRKHHKRHRHHKRAHSNRGGKK